MKPVRKGQKEQEIQTQPKERVSQKLIKPCWRTSWTAMWGKWVRNRLSTCLNIPICNLSKQRCLGQWPSLQSCWNASCKLLHQHKSNIVLWKWAWPAWWISLGLTFFQPISSVRRKCWLAGELILWQCCFGEGWLQVIQASKNSSRSWMSHRPASWQASWRGWQGLRKQRKVCMPRKGFWKRRKVRWPWHQMAGQQCWPPQLTVILLDQQLNQNHQQLVHHGLIYRKAHPLSWRAIGRQQLENMWKNLPQREALQKGKSWKSQLHRARAVGLQKMVPGVVQILSTYHLWNWVVARHKANPTHARWPRWL